MAARESIANQINNLKAVLDEHDAAIDELTDDSVGHCLHSGVDAIRANINTLIGDHCLKATAMWAIEENHIPYGKELRQSAKKD